MFWVFTKIFGWSKISCSVSCLGARKRVGFSKLLFSSNVFSSISQLEKIVNIWVSIKACDNTNSKLQ